MRNIILTGFALILSSSGISQEIGDIQIPPISQRSAFQSTSELVGVYGVFRGKGRSYMELGIPGPVSAGLSPIIVRISTRTTYYPSGTVYDVELKYDSQKKMFHGSTNVRRYNGVAESFYELKKLEVVAYKKGDKILLSYWFWGVWDDFENGKLGPQEGGDTLQKLGIEDIDSPGYPRESYEQNPDFFLSDGRAKGENANLIDLNTFVIVKMAVLPQVYDPDVLEGTYKLSRRFCRPTGKKSTPPNEITLKKQGSKLVMKNVGANDWPLIWDSNLNGVLYHEFPTWDGLRVRDITSFVSHTTLRERMQLPWIKRGNNPDKGDFLDSIRLEEEVYLDRIQVLGVQSKTGEQVLYVNLGLVDNTTPESRSADQNTYFPGRVYRQWNACYSKTKGKEL